MKPCYPLYIDDQRSLPDDYSGNVFVWDVDKTYLSTHFSSMRGLLRIPIEFAVDKRAIPGMPEVLRGLRHGPGERYAAVPLYFLSASPKELRKVLERKMLLDGVEYDGLILKDWTRAVLGGRPGRLKEQVGFKLCAPLTARRSRPTAVEYLFGDDTEQDAEAFHLYARMLAGELRGEQADRAMAQAEVAADDRACVHALLRTLPATHGSVGRAFIHLERGTPPSFFSKFGGLVVPVKGAIQLALALFASGLIRTESVTLAAAAARSIHGPAFDRDGLVQEARERGLISAAKLQEIAW